MDTEYKTKLNVAQSFNCNISTIPINKMQLFHFFVDDPNKSTELIDSLQHIKMNIRAPATNKVIGTINLSLKDFKSPLVN